MTKEEITMAIKDKAKKAAGRARCTQCKFWINEICIDPSVAQVCYENFVKGFLKGYNEARKEK